RSRAPPRRARAGAGPPAHHARTGGAVMREPRTATAVARRLQPSVLLLCLAGAACNRAPQPDAYGNVEATDVVVSAETAGRLVTYTVVGGEEPRGGAGGRAV